MGENIKILHRGIDTLPLLKQIQDNLNLFEQFKERQETPGSPHKDTQTIFLRWCEDKSVEAAFTELEAIDYPAYAVLTEARPIVDTVCDVVGATKLGRVIIPALKPQGVITKHADEGAYADHYERFHVCLQAGRGNVLTVQMEDRIFEGLDADPGELFWFNHKQPHMCINPTGAYRIHLIVDAVAPQYKRPRVVGLKRPQIEKPKIELVKNG